MVDIVGILNFGAWLAAFVFLFLNRHVLIPSKGFTLNTEENQEILTQSVLSAVVALGTMDEFAEYREGITQTMQPLFADAMTGVIEEFNAAMTENMPSPEEIQSAQHHISREIMTQGVTQDIPEVLKPSIEKMFSEDGQFGENPILGSIIMGWLGRSGILGGITQLTGLPEGPKSTSQPIQPSQQGGW